MREGGGGAELRSVSWREEGGEKNWGWGWGVGVYWRRGNGDIGGEMIILVSTYLVK